MENDRSRSYAFRQFEIIRPYLDLLRGYTPKQGDLIEFFFLQLSNAISMRAEHEKEPENLPISDYSSRSLVLISVMMFKTVVHDLSAYLDTETLEKLYDKLVQFVQEKGSDLRLLNISLIRIMGLEILHDHILAVAEYHHKEIDFN